MIIRLKPIFIFFANPTTCSLSTLHNTRNTKPYRENQIYHVLIVMNKGEGEGEGEGEIIKKVYILKLHPTIMYARN